MSKNAIHFKTINVNEVRSAGQHKNNKDKWGKTPDLEEVIAWEEDTYAR